ncbi:DUF6114 domain-containing protein [Streptomyces sp. NPDC052040]|uniref:DUF6114 domain-containing protein n=1 Tax=unclassified Streptomyces TaxID=2593676 RepID=UPI0037D8EFFF
MFRDPFPFPFPFSVRRFPVRRPRRAAVVGSWQAFRVWRGERPFWAGLFTVVAGLPIMYFPSTGLDLQGVVLALSTTSGAASLVIGVLLVVLGLCLWFQRHARGFAAAAVLLLSLVSFPLANFGGLFLGLLCGLIGGSLACAWIPPGATAGPTPGEDPAGAARPPADAEGAGR